MLSTRRSGRDSLVQQVLLLEARVIPLSVVVSVQPLNTRYASPASEGDHPDACCCLLSYQVILCAGAIQSFTPQVCGGFLEVIARSGDTCPIRWKGDDGPSGTNEEHPLKGQPAHEQPDLEDHVIPGSRRDRPSHVHLI